MKRRILLIALAGTAIPLGRLRAAGTDGLPRIGCLGSRASFEPIAAELASLGRREGRDFSLDVRYPGAAEEQLPQMAAALAATNPQVIVAATTPFAIAARAATSTIPIVFYFVSDPVGAGLVKSLAHPGGNVTGVIDLIDDLVARQVQLLREILPSLRRVATLVSDNPAHPKQAAEVEAMTQKLRLEYRRYDANALAEFEAAFADAGREKGTAMVVLGGGRQATHRDRIVQLAASNRVPAVYPQPAYVRAGGLMSCGPSLQHQARIVAGMLQRVLSGARPSETPVQQVTEVGLAINQKAARGLGITFPKTVMVQAIEVIE